MGLGTGKWSIRSWSSKWCSNESLIFESFSRPSGTQCTNQSFYWHGSFFLLAFHTELPRISVLHHLSTYIVGVSAYPTSTTVVIYIYVIYNVTSSLQEGWSGVKKKIPFQRPEAREDTSGSTGMSEVLLKTSQHLHFNIPWSCILPKRQNCSNFRKLIEQKLHMIFRGKHLVERSWQRKKTI